MSRMEEKNRRRKKVRRYIANAVLFTVMLIAATVIVGADGEPAQTLDNGWVPRYEVRAAPQKIATSAAKSAEGGLASQGLRPAPQPQLMVAFVADGVMIGAVETKEQAQFVLDSLLTYYRDAHPDETDVAFLSEPEFLHVLMSDEMVSARELYLSLRNEMESAVQNALQTTMQSAVQMDESGGDMPVDIEALAATPVCITSTKTETLTEVLKYETETIEDDNMVIGARNVHQDGRNGERIATYQYNYINGVVVSSDLLEEIVTKESVSKVVRIGTKKPYAKPGNDGSVPNFRYPCSGRISSYYGMRRGRMHYGIDIVTKTGTPLKASLGGVVTYAGERGNYGLLVEIDHGNGFVTRYAHCSKILVSVGERVSAGEVVAKVGSTGNSACPHVHFEIRLNGSARDPMPYL